MSGPPGSRPLTSRPGPVRELAVGLSTFALYLLVDALGGSTRTAAAHAHALDLFRWERWLHLDVEPRANAWLDAHPLLRTLANYEYGSTYIVAAFGLLAWLWWRRPDEYRRARASFVVLNLFAFGCFIAYPLMPPRLVPGLGFVDTVTQGHTVGSWGSPLVAHANQLAAMPSLHVGWALWVSVVLARISGDRRSRILTTQVISALHVALTVYVVVATANHYLLDAVGAGVAVVASSLITKDMRSSRVPAADAFFLQIESPRYPQHVGGVVPLDVSDGPDGSPSRQDVVDVIRTKLGELPRFRQRLVFPASRWRGPRWQDVDELDWDWHVPLRDLTRPDGSPGGQRSFDRLVAELADTELPRDRPLWRMVVVHGVDQGVAAVVLIVHHVIADGIGTVAQALHLLEPLQQASLTGGPRIGPARRTAAIVTGLAQLATDGQAAPLKEQSRQGAGRRFARITLPLGAVRTAAKAADARVSDLLLSAVAGGLARLELSLMPDELRVAVPLMVREPGSAAEGNLTAAVMIDLPVGQIPESQRLREIARRSNRLRTGSRALASRFVMADIGTLMPVPLHAWFARTVYGSRYFHGIVSNMPGPDAALSLAKRPVLAAYPLLPLAPGTALVVGTLGWNGELCISITTGEWLLERTDDFVSSIHATLRELGVDSA